LTNRDGHIGHYLRDYFIFYCTSHRSTLQIFPGKPMILEMAWIKLSEQGKNSFAPAFRISEIGLSIWI
jgi:hypothetical protein